MNKLRLSALTVLTVLSMGLAAQACKGGCHKDKKAFHKGGKHFIKMADSNDDGKLDLSEMKTNAALRFAEGDTNKDGSITLAEMNSNIESRFLAGDTNKDGFLERSEIMTQFKEHWKKKDIQ
jgi:Ca2+-binding EF-hand superfamily protein